MPRRKMDASIGSDHDDRKRGNISSPNQVAGSSSGVVSRPTVNQPKPPPSIIVGRPFRRPSPNTAYRMRQQRDGNYHDDDDEEEEEQEVAPAPKLGKPAPPQVIPLPPVRGGRTRNVWNDNPTNAPKFSLQGFKLDVKELQISAADMRLQNVDDVPLKEDVKWIISSDRSALTFDTLIDGRKIGTPITSVKIDEEKAFIDPELYYELIDCKALFQKMPKDDYRIVRGKGNMFEKVDKGPFLCRAAMKMANLDAILNHELTNPMTRDGHPVLGLPDLFYFADVCAGPGGFTEYILWMKKWEAKGFGLTLKGELDFDLQNLHAETETFDTFYGRSGTGDIYIPINVTGFIEHVLSNTGNKGVHLMMADGGFSVTGQENMQELLSQHIILAQIYVALAIVRVGGHVVCKLFDTVTPFTVALIYFMYCSFETVTIHKPVSSRQANSERYLICKWKKSENVTSPIVKYLKDCHEKMWVHKNAADNNEAILELVPVSVLANLDDPFYNYLFDCNNRLISSQIATLKRMAAFVLNKSLDNEPMQWKAKTRAMKHWCIPAEIPMPAMLRQPENGANAVLQGDLKSAILKRHNIDVVPGNLQVFQSLYDWRAVPTTLGRVSGNRGFFLSLGGYSLFKYNGTGWTSASTQAKALSIMMPSKTLFYGEFGLEVRERSGPVENFDMVLHIIDALMLGGMDLRNMHYTRRLEMAEKFAQALTIPERLIIRAKPLIRMEQMLLFIEKIKGRDFIRGGTPRPTCPMDMNNPDSAIIFPRGFLFLKITKDPWQMILDPKINNKVFFNTASGHSTRDTPMDAVASFFDTMENRMLWSWDRATSLRMEAPYSSMGELCPDHVHTCTFMNLFKGMTRPPKNEQDATEASTLPKVQP
ncbi:cap-specific mRNA (nucleoside-2'-O-)-methyltransferase 1 [Folsomia candida]|uniref:cap-specific mRNA (nucleoside-2'-O-)-methyltransferase 1 n=1 Tax=Folsomia candida TaxID=158441 RepID=UPI000B90527B|nr:cap-specific mRNA (nucleoside-2'-O-)-methyltransferase 1 [Folsomia candida]